MHSEDTDILLQKYPAYDGSDLGLTVSSGLAQFRLWSPQATEAQVLLYTEGLGGYPAEVIQMESSVSGTWLSTQPRNLYGLYYTYRVKIKDEWSLDVPDPYSKAVGINGHRTLILNLADTDPQNWDLERSPDVSAHNSPEEAVIYEVHIRDLGMHSSSGIRQKGKYLSLTETNTLNKDNLTTGISHIREMGVTHIHLLPINDFMSVDETLPPPGSYNWGYDPSNYFVPEGSYSTDPADGASRIRECKEMIKGIHQNGLRVVLDVVFNHTGFVKKNIFHQLVPGYYFRHLADGTFSDASGCGNETASERPMFRKFMTDCLCYWLTEYHVDGFRFDLMGIHDAETMRIIARELRQIRPDILLYGEGWAGGDSPYPHHLRAVKDQAPYLNGIAVFSDDIRDAIKGKVFNTAERGFVSGAHHLEQTIRAGIVASCPHPQVHYRDSNQPGHAFATAPGQVISYCECHDNHTLWDRLAISNPEATEKERKKMHRLALAIILTSQGIPFLHAGTEFLRSKYGVENSYKSPDDINAINWNLKTEHADLVHDILTLILIRKNHPAFRIVKGDDIVQYLRFDEHTHHGTIAYTIFGEPLGDQWKKIWVGINSHAEKKKFHLPAGNWQQVFPTPKKSRDQSGYIYLPGISLEIFCQRDQ